MSYRLVLSEEIDPNAPKAKRGAKENVFFENLPPDSKVYILYYPGVWLNKNLAKKLKELGNMAGKNLFVNIAKRLDDPFYPRIVKSYSIKKLPTVIITALDSLASPPTDYSTAFVRIDDRNLLESTETAVNLIQKIFNLFIGGEVAKAMHENSRDSRMFRLKGLLKSALQSLGSFLEDKEINFYTAVGRLEIKSKK